MRRTRPSDRCPTWTSTLTKPRWASLSRRAFLRSTAGGSLLALFGLPSVTAETSDGGDGPPALDEALTWQILDRVQQHLLPSEPGIPGAQEINALIYLRFVVQDPKVEAETRAFIPQGAVWLEDMARQLTQRSFLALDAAGRERVLRRIAGSRAGERWLSTLLTYLMEALLTDPAYGGNPGGIGWRWLQHTPGYPRPSAETIYPRLRS